MNDVQYVIVAGVLWLRLTNEPAVWLADWTGRPTARKWRVDELPHMDATGTRGVAGDAAWDLSFHGAGRPYVFPHPLARRLATTQFTVEQPSLSVSGWFEVDGRRHELDGAPGHRARVRSSRYADRFVWAQRTSLRSAGSSCSLRVSRDSRSSPRTPTSAAS
jgi:hypothetical protein